MEKDGMGPLVIEGPTVDLSTSTYNIITNRCYPSITQIYPQDASNATTNDLI